MAAPNEFKIDLSEEFQTLGKAPIVESVIDLRARIEGSWEEATIMPLLKSKLPDYPTVLSQRETSQEVKLTPGEPPEAIEKDLGWKGLRMESTDKLQIAQFNRDGFAFSRLMPYESWQQFYNEARRLWSIYSELAKPIEIQRAGLRFINRIMLPGLEVKIEDYLNPFPKPPHGLELPFANFFHHEVFSVPAYRYAINVIRAIQPIQNNNVTKIGLILDIDAFTTHPFELSPGVLDQRLLEMRWLKNKAFFGSITPLALESFK
jgi:uncharacterized protein (TIGR04255 family)